MQEVKQISDTALHLKTKVEEVSHEKDQNFTAYQAGHTHLNEWSGVVNEERENWFYYIIL